MVEEIGLDQRQLAADLLERGQAGLQFLGAVLGGDDGPHSRAVVGDGGEADALGEDPSSNSRSESFMASAPLPAMTGVMGVSE